MASIVPIIWLLCMHSWDAYTQSTADSIPPVPNSYVDLMQKAKRQKTGGWVLTSLGTIGLVLTMGADATQTLGGSMTTLFSLGTVEPEYKDYTALYVASGAVMLTGVGLLIHGGSLKRKARAAQGGTYLKMEQATVLKTGGATRLTYPAIAWRVSL